MKREKFVLGRGGKGAARLGGSAPSPRWPREAGIRTRGRSPPELAALWAIPHLNRSSGSGLWVRNLDF